MTTPVTDKLKEALSPVAEFIRDRALNPALQDELNRQFPADSDAFRSIATACRQGIDAGELCQREAGSIRYGRVFEPSERLADCSVDVVLMRDVVGPHHSHPNGEIDMVVPLSPDAKFDGSGAGWVVYEPGSAHSPTVTAGDAVVLYLLPGGKIQFTRA